MTRVFFLRHFEEKREDGTRGEKTIGAYSTADKAREQPVEKNAERRESISIFFNCKSQ